MQGFRPVAGQAKAVGCHAVSQEMDTTAAWRRCKDSSHCVRGKRESWRWRAPPQIPAPIATLTSAPVWKRRNHAFRSTWDNATTFKEQNIIACRCPDIFTSKRHHLFQTLRGHRDSPSLSRSTSSVVVDHLLSIRACFPGCLGLENAFLDLCCATGHEETSFVRLRLMRQIGV